MHRYTMHRLTRHNPMEVSMNKELMKGTTEMILLNVLRRGPMYGYGIIQALSLSTKGLFEMKEGTLYPILHQLEKNGDVTSYWQQVEGERKRKYYELTKNGMGKLKEKEVEWEQFSQIITGLLH